jgi:hypothetical protein
MAYIETESKAVPVGIPKSTVVIVTILQPDHQVWFWLP